MDLDDDDDEDDDDVDEFHACKMHWHTLLE